MSLEDELAGKEAEIERLDRIINKLEEEVATLEGAVKGLGILCRSKDLLIRELAHAVVYYISPEALAKLLGRARNEINEQGNSGGGKRRRDRPLADGERRFNDGNP